MTLHDLAARCESATAEYALIAPSFNARGNSNYTPCDIGIHLCGIATHPEGHGDANGEQPYTALNLEARNDIEAQRMWEAARLVAEVSSREEADFLCDLNLNAGYADGFYTNRQLVPQLVAAALRARAQIEGQEA